MNIVETNIPDITVGNIDEAKLVLSNRIIESVYPLLDEVYSDQLSEIEGLRTQLKDKRKEVQESKTNLENLISDYNRKKKVKKLVDRISKLVSAGLVYDGSLKNETVILLKVVEKLPENKLDEHLSRMVKLISKRFSRR